MRVKLSVLFFSFLFISFGMITQAAEGPKKEEKKEEAKKEEEKKQEEKKEAKEKEKKEEVKKEEEKKQEEKKEAEEKEEEKKQEEKKEAEEKEEKKKPEEKREAEEKKEKEVEAEAEEEEKPEKMIGFDTIGIKEPEGNWLLKRAWWEKAQKKYEKIKNVVARIVESRMQFFKKRNEIDRNLFDPFYSEVGLGQGQIEEVLSYLMNEVEKERQEEHGLSEVERDYLATLTAEKRVLDQMKLDVVGIRKLDIAIDEDLDELMKQINLSRRYEEQAWQLFKGIAKVLNHKKARELYYQMDTFWKNVKDIAGYINGAFKNHFDSIVQNAQNQVSRLKASAAAFKQKGIDLKKQFEKIQDEEEAEKKTEEVATPEEPEEEPEEEAERGGWLESIYNAITWPFRKIWSLISSLWK